MHRFVTEFSGRAAPKRDIPGDSNRVFNDFTQVFFGFQTIDNCNMAVAEKALLDTLYYRKGILPVEDEMELEGLDHARLMDMAGAYPATVSTAARRLVNVMD